MTKTSVRIAALAAMIHVLAHTAPAQTPLGTAFTYQGQLKDGGSPANGLHDLRFRLYDAAEGGAQVGAIVCFDNVSVTDGLFTVPLDFGAQFAGDERFLEIDVRADSGRDCTNSAGFVVLSPRQALTTAPLAAYAMNADQLDGLDSSAFLQSIPVPLTLSGTGSGWIIKGENASTASGSASINGTSTGASGTTYGGYFLNSSTSGTGTVGISNAISGTTYGVRGQSSSPDGRGVYGAAIATTGDAYGVWGRSTSTSGRGVFGEAAANSGTTYGGYFESDSTSGRGVYGSAPANSGVTYGGRFESDSSDGYGVYATGGRWGVYSEATAATVTTYGGRFESASTSGRGVHGEATAGTGTTYGVYGVSVSTTGRGVFGEATAATGLTTYGGRFESASTSGRGVSGLAYAFTGTTYGVYGDGGGSPNGYGVWAQGRLGASGSKSFRIDHPDDPANKYLLHYSAESPEVINFYRGTVTLDSAGAAVVELPHYFAKINKTPSYQLTAVGAPMPMLHVAEEIDEAALSAGATAEPAEAAPACSFRIAGGAPGAKVSWRVEAVRNDRWVQQRGAPVEVEKEGLEKGTYQHPELYGQPPEMGMNYDAEHERPSVPAQSEATPH